MTTIADDDGQNGQEEVGRVGGWIASIDKLLADPMGVLCLQVSQHCVVTLVLVLLRKGRVVGQLIASKH